MALRLSILGSKPVSHPRILWCRRSVKAATFAYLSITLINVPSIVFASEFDGGLSAIRAAADIETRSHTDQLDTPKTDTADIERRTRLSDKAQELFGRLEKPNTVNTEAIPLGRQLFHDPNLSKDGSVSCATCHILDEGGDDNIQFSTGISGNPTARNSPTVFNLDGQVAFFWDGRAKTLEDQIDGPIQHPDEMGADWSEIEQYLQNHPQYRASFRRVFGRSPNRADAKTAIADFERSLVANDTQFDAFLNGEVYAISAEAVRGLENFISFGCVSCHQGPLVGGNLFQRFGLFTERVENANVDQLFKVPSLRNVSVTAPYFHDGRAETLSDAIRTMVTYQIGESVDETAVREIKSFLTTLTDKRFNDAPDREVKR